MLYGEICMKRKIIGLLICMLMLGAILPAVSASPPRLNQIQRFGTCLYHRGRYTDQ
jgi:hypothetical protein